MIAVHAMAVVVVVVSVIPAVDIEDASSSPQIVVSAGRRGDTPAKRLGDPPGRQQDQFPTFFVVFYSGRSVHPPSTVGGGIAAAAAAAVAIAIAPPSERCRRGIPIATAAAVHEAQFLQAQIPRIRIRMEIGIRRGPQIHPVRKGGEIVVSVVVVVVVVNGKRPIVPRVKPIRDVRHGRRGGGIRASHRFQPVQSVCPPTLTDTHARNITAAGRRK
mmetsp:Transcript_17630/g.36600  ORF Transcript_17630/g.36600 Transcript_17630/m.36600 type:complete len:216 (+) Transcript_17630:2006-2653(+)